MAISANVRFFCNLEHRITTEHPPGEPIANLVRNGLLQRGWRATGLENWRDCGWVFDCSKECADLRLILAEMASKSHWLLQISPKYIPGLIGRLLDKKSSGSPKDVYLTAKDVHETFATHERFSLVRWCWDGVPNEHNATEQPTMPSASGE